MKHIVYVYAESEAVALAQVRRQYPQNEIGEVTQDAMRWRWRVEVIAPVAGPMTREDLLAALDAGENLRVDGDLLLLGDPALSPPVDLVKQLVREGVLEQHYLAADYVEFRRKNA